VKFVHAADLHIDSPLAGLARYPGAPVEQIRGATRRALSNLVQLCEQEGASLLLLAGDLFDGEWRDYNTGLFFATQMARLKRLGVRVVSVRGNHDAASQISKHLSLPDNVYEFSHRAPESRVFPELGVAVHGQSYARRAETADLADAYPDALPGYLNLGLLHTSVGGRPGHENYAPCKLETLLSKGYDYWALGHVHQQEILHERPWVVFPGNLQGRHIRELGPKGAMLVSVEAGQIESVEHRALDVVRWERLQIDLASEQHPEQVLDRVVRELAERVEQLAERVLVARVDLVGQTPVHAALARDWERWEASIRAQASELDRVWIESVRLQTQGLLSLESLQLRPDALGQVARSLHALRMAPEQLRSWSALFDDLRQKLPPEVRQGSAGIQFDEPEVLQALILEMEQLLLSRLLALGDGDLPHENADVRRPGE
jgi:DNA repair protein SbcD/Mre11